MCYQLWKYTDILVRISRNYLLARIYKSTYKEQRF
nr:MAG TPA: hypothetical protein [Caudoviricetes sp.]DAH97203.1 MAG TPA: hypothetical protein [Bacteriophage sp.]